MMDISDIIVGTIYIFWAFIFAAASCMICFLLYVELLKRFKRGNDDI